ncbi:MAG: MBL fold metallo-hydrolase [Acidobacteria bacterium]|nr:MBL fold metallo-hydrolase [Acidobacteriota bacterium]
MSRKFALIAAAFAFLALPSWTAFGQQPPAREITRVSGDVYRFRNLFHFSVFMVTPAGIIVGDPINPEAAQWLKEELAKRFSRPVKYLIYSHDHDDHISGGQVFADTALVVAHENAKAAILGEKRPTATPQIVFSDRLNIELGGKEVQLIHLGKNHSDNMIVLLFPAERVLFAVDFIAIETLPYQDFPDAYVEDWIESLKRVEALDFDTLVLGHGMSTGRKDHVALFRRYLEELRDQVLRYAREKKSLEEIKALVKMEKYSSWGQYKEFLPLNIEGMFRHVQLHRRANP